jgi:hypothetical protein
MIRCISGGRGVLGSAALTRAGRQKGTPEKPFASELVVERLTRAEGSRVHLQMLNERPRSSPSRSVLPDVEVKHLGRRLHPQYDPGLAAFLCKRCADPAFIARVIGESAFIT